MTNLIYAIGDIHGRIDLLGQLHDHIRDFHQLQHANLPAEIIYIGDYIDGGACGIDVIDLLMRGVEGFRTHYLLGNHEDMMLRCLETDDRDVWYTWVSNGGDKTLSNLGISTRFGGNDPTELRRTLGEKRIAWLQDLPLYRRIGPYLFVHAGIVPGLPIEKQNRKDLLWIRSRFLESTEDHGAIIVHGHTPGDEPVVKPNRICVDTGATSNGVLTAAVLDGKSPPIFLRARGAG